MPQYGRRSHVLLSLLLLLTGCARRPPVMPAADPGSIDLAVVAWNMHAGRGDLPRLVSDLVAGRITGAVPDDYVLLLQEATTSSAGARRSGTGGGGGEHDVATFAGERQLSVFFTPVHSGTARRSGNAILSTRPLEEPRHIDLPRERQPRAAAAAVVDLDGIRLFVVSAHLENRLGWLRGLFGDRARQRQAAALLDALPPGHGIIGGDMNTMLGPDEPVLRLLFERFADTPKDDPQPTFRDRLVLDYVFFDLPDGWTAARRVVADTYGSDHHPVLGIITVARTQTLSQPGGRGDGERGAARLVRHRVKQHVHAQGVSAR